MSSRVGRGVVFGRADAYRCRLRVERACKKSLLRLTDQTARRSSQRPRSNSAPRGSRLPPFREGEVKDVRPETGHFHLAIDADCLPPGQEIPKADPWVHFGKAQTSVETSLTPGPHKLTLQAGDDLHRTMEGLCETINVTVAP